MGKLEQDSMEFLGKSGRSCPMTRVSTFVFSARIMKDREKFKDFGIGLVEPCEPLTIRVDPAPVRHTMRSHRVQSILGEDALHEARSRHAWCEIKLYSPNQPYSPCEPPENENTVHARCRGYVAENPEDEKPKP